MSINITDEFHAATTKGKIASAKEVFLTGDKENLQQIGEKTHQLEDSLKNIAATGGASTAAAVTFDNAASGMTAVNAQGAIEELNTKNKMQDTELSKKANSVDVYTKIDEEKTRVDGELEKKFAKANIVQESGESKQNIISQYGVTTLFSKAHAVAVFNYIKMTNSLPPFIMGHFYLSDGHIVTTKLPYGYSPLIYLAPGIEYTIKASSTNDAKIVVYDKTGKTIIGSYNSDKAQLVLNSSEEERYVVISNNFSIVSSPRILFDVYLTKNVDELTKNVDELTKNVDELNIQEIDFLRILEPAYSRINAANRVNSLIESSLAETSEQLTVETKENYYISSNNSVGKEIKLTAIDTWTTELIKVDNNFSIRVNNIAAPQEGKTVYLLIDENNIILKKQILKDDTNSHFRIPTLDIYPGSAYKVAVCHPKASNFTATTTTTTLASGVVNLNNLHNSILSLFNTKSVPISINSISWVTGFYSNTGEILNNTNWLCCKVATNSTDYNINVNHINVAESGKLVILFWKSNTIISSITLENTSEDYSFSEKIPNGATHWSINRRISNDAVTISIDRITKNVNEVSAQEITIENSDKIAIIGDSYTESHFTVKNKAYINKLSLFSDYEFVNWGVSGDIYIGRLNAIRQGDNRYNTLSFKDIAPKYAMMCCYTNDIKYMGVDEYINSLDNICTVLQGLGVEPIICTEYHTGNNSESNTSVKTALLNYAVEHNYLFFDIATYCDILRPKSWNSHYSPFWGGSHAGTRANALEADPYEMYLKGLERPEKSIKLFRLRRKEYSSLDSLLFRNNTERAEKFQEINVGHTHITDASLVDNCSSAKQTVQVDEYQNIQKGVEVTFDNVCLASVTLPYLTKNVSKVSIKVKNTGKISKVYVLNRLIQPYNSYTKYTRFDYTSLTEKPLVGDTYTSSNDDNTQVFTVQKIVENVGDAGTLGSIFCTPSNSSTNSGGTLTKVTGNGDSIIPYNYRSIGYDSSNIIDDTAGHWEEINLSGDEYVVTSPNSSIDLDKVHLLLTGTNIGISDIIITCCGSGTKLYNRKQISLNYNRQYSVNSYVID